MPNHRYYYYDHDSCSFKEMRPGRVRKYVHLAAGTLTVALLLAAAATWALDRAVATPQELALEAENQELQHQLEQAGDQMQQFAHRLDQLAVSDQQLYRTLLGADPISEDVRQVGVGGTDSYEQYDRYSMGTASLLRETSQQIETLSRRIRLQNSSYRSLTNLAAEREEWIAEMPALLPANGPVVSGYGLRRHPILRVRKMHHGLDILVPTGTPVVAPGDGVVKRTGYGGGFGRFVEVEHPATGYSTLYAHLSEIPKAIRKGVHVKRGQVIAHSGNTGRSSGPHLHYEVRDSDGRTINPVHLLAPSMTPQKYQELLAETEQSTSSLD